jgi:hypothetical protein
MLAWNGFSSAKGKGARWVGFSLTLGILGGLGVKTSREFRHNVGYSRNKK